MRLHVRPAVHMTRLGLGGHRLVGVPDQCALPRVPPLELRHRQPLELDSRSRTRGPSGVGRRGSWAGKDFRSSMIPPNARRPASRSGASLTDWTTEPQLPPTRRRNLGGSVHVASGKRLWTVPRPPVSGGYGEGPEARASLTRFFPELAGPAGDSVSRRLAILSRSKRTSGRRCWTALTSR